MSEKDINIGQAEKAAVTGITEAQEALRQAPAVASATAKELEKILNDFGVAGLAARIASLEKTVAATAISAQKPLADAKTAIQGAERIPIAGMIPLKGSGAAVADVTAALQVVKSLPAGLRTSMTKAQKVIRTIYAIFAMVAGILVIVGAFLTNQHVTAGAGLIATASGIKEILAVANSGYKDLTGEDISSQ